MVHTEGSGMELVSDAAIVTGGASGIGYGIAKALMENGASVGIADIDGDAATEASDRLTDQYRADAAAFECDVTDSTAVTAMMDAAADEFGSVGILVNNAGLGGLDRTWELDEAEWDRVHDVCLKGTFLCTKAGVNHMLDTDSPGAIINISSLSGLAATDGYPHYCSAKAGVCMLTEVVAAETGPYGIRANAIAPGIVETPLTERSNLLRGRIREEYLDHTPLGRIGHPDDIAAVAVFLASDAARWITGETIATDGGMHIWGSPKTWTTFQTMGIVED